MSRVVPSGLEQEGDEEYYVLLGRERPGVLNISLSKSKAFPFDTINEWFDRNRIVEYVCVKRFLEVLRMFSFDLFVLYVWLILD